MKIQRALLSVSDKTGLVAFARALVDRFGVLAGLLSAADLIGDEAYVSAVAKPALVARTDSPALNFIAPLTDGRAHEVVVVDEGRRVIGLLTQTDLLVAMARQEVG